MKLTDVGNSIKDKDVSDRLMQETAEELGVPITMVREIIIRGHSAFTAETMKNNSFDGVRWPWLGKFTTKVKSAQVLKHMKGLTSIQREFFFAKKEYQNYKKGFKGKKKKENGK